MSTEKCLGNLNKNGHMEQRGVGRRMTLNASCRNGSEQIMTGEMKNVRKSE